jgi:Icc-related predicted phosphoesterase
VRSGRWLDALPSAEAFGHSGRTDIMEEAFVQVGWQGTIPSFRSGDIVLAHAPPAGCFTSTSKGSGVDNGDIDLADALTCAATMPWLVLSGHVHNPARWKDRCGGTVTLNPGVTEGAEVPNYTSIDTATRRARLFRDGELADATSLQVELGEQP